MMTLTPAILKQRRAAALTILECVMAVIILGLISTVLFSIVRSTLKSIALVSEDINDRLAIERLLAMVQEELYNIPVRGSQNAILGKGVRLNNRDMDTLEWRSRGGPGLLTTAVSGEYRVRLRLLPIKGVSGKYEIGIEREKVLDETAQGLTQVVGSAKPDWIPLIPNAGSLRVRYFDPRMNTEQVSDWTDPSAKPSYVRITITREDEDTPVEAVISIPAGLVQQ